MPFSGSFSWYNIHSAYSGIFLSSNMRLCCHGMCKFFHTHGIFYACSPYVLSYIPGSIFLNKILRPLYVPCHRQGIFLHFPVPWLLSIRLLHGKLWSSTFGKVRTLIIAFYHRLSTYTTVGMFY